MTTTTQATLSTSQILASMGAAGSRLDHMDAVEASAGNISVALAHADLTDFPRAEAIDLPLAVPVLAGYTVFVTGSGQRLRDVAATPLACVAAVTVGADGTSATLHYADQRAFAQPTSEFNSHLAVHADQVERRGVQFHVAIHAQPPHLVTLSHIPELNQTRTFSRRILRWEPETIVQLPAGIGVLPYMVPGSGELMAGNLRMLAEHEIVLWSKHGIMVRSDVSALAAVDKIEYAETGARYELANMAAGERGTGLSDEELRAVIDAFGIETELY